MEIVLDFLYSGQPGKVKGEYFTRVRVLLLMFLGSISGVRMTKSRGEGILPYMDYIGMCRCEGHGFQAVYSRIGYINQSVWV